MAQHKRTPEIPSPYEGLSICPHCLHDIPFVLPVEPVYDLTIAAYLIPTTEGNLRRILTTKKNTGLFGPPRYRQTPAGRLKRMLSASEIRNIREHRFVYKDWNGNNRQPNERGL